MPILFERYEAKGRFNEVEVRLDFTEKPATLITRSGKCGLDGRTHVKDFASEEAAMKEAAKRLKAIHKKEMELVSAPAEEPANEELAASILKDENDDALQVYADWAHEQELPRGEFAVANHQRDENPDDAVLGKTFEKLLKKHGDLLGPPRLAKLVAKKRTAGRSEDCYSSCTWRHGFLHSVHLSKFSRAPNYSVRELINELLRHPGARFLRKLTVGLVGENDDHNYGPIIDAIAEHRPQALRELGFGLFGDEADLNYASCENLDRLQKACPGLRRLSMRGDSLGWVVLDLPELRSLFVETARMGECIDNLLQSQTPKLEVLHLGYRDGISPAAKLVALLDRLELSELRITGSHNTATVLPALTKAVEALGRLRVLSFANGDLCDDDRAALDKLREALPNTQIDVSGNYFSDKDSQSRPLALRAFLPAAAQCLGRSQEGAHPYLRREGLLQFTNKLEWAQRGVSDTLLWGASETRAPQFSYGDEPAYCYLSLEGEFNCSCSRPAQPCEHTLGLARMAQGSEEVPSEEMPADLKTKADDNRYEASWE